MLLEVLDGGCSLVVMVLLLPMGIVGMLRGYWERLIIFPSCGTVPDSAEGWSKRLG